MGSGNSVNEGCVRESMDPSGNPRKLSLSGHERDSGQG